MCVCNTVFSLIERGKFSSAYRVFFSCVLLSISLCLKTSENLDHKERHNSTPTLLKTQHKKCLPSKPRLLFRSLPPRKRKNVKRKPRECSRASLPRWISNSISRRCLFLRYLGDGWNFGRYPRKFLSPKKERVRVRVVSKRANSTHRQRYIHLHPPNVSLQSRVAVRVVRKPARIRDIRDENLFFLSPAFCLKVWFLPKRYAKMKRDFTPEETKENCLRSVCAIPERLFNFFFTLTPLSLSLSLCVCVCVIHQCRKPQQIAAAGAAAIMLFNSAPAQAEIMGLTLQNGVPNAAAQKFVQPLVPDGRPVVYVEKDGSADITTFDGRLAANVARSNVGCKTITGQPCVDFASGASK